MKNVKYIDFSRSTLCGNVRMSASKSISNRVLVIQALAGVAAKDFDIKGLATAQDTQILAKLLASDSSIYDAQDAGTTFRFLTAYLSIIGKKKLLTGTARMLERPIAPLVNGLRSLGANITYTGQEGFPPLQFDAPDRILLFASETPKIEIEADISSQFASAILLIAPILPQGLHLTLTKQMVSLPYLDMTIRLMSYFGIDIERKEQVIFVKNGNYIPKALQIEPDWSSASYYYSAVALAKGGSVYLEGLSENSLQGDAVLAKIYHALGVHTTYTESGIKISKQPDTLKPLLQYDFTHCPDIAQTVIVTCAALGVQGLFTGLDSLLIKETNRLAALKAELAKIGVTFTKLPPHFSKKQPEKMFYLLEGKATLEHTPHFHTYHDHRMAMSFAPLAFLHKIGIESPEVVEKSYPEFWDDLESLIQRQ